jgi:hypothetical protein
MLQLKSYTVVYPASMEIEPWLFKLSDTDVNRLSLCRKQRGLPEMSHVGASILDSVLSRCFVQEVDARNPAT